MISSIIIFFWGTILFRAKTTTRKNDRRISISTRFTRDAWDLSILRLELFHLSSELRGPVTKTLPGKKAWLVAATRFTRELLLSYAKLSDEGSRISRNNRRQAHLSYIRSSTKKQGIYVCIQHKLPCQQQTKCAGWFITGRRYGRAHRRDFFLQPLCRNLRQKDK